MSTELVAVVLAGGSADRVAAEAHEETKAAVRFGGRPLLEYVLDALRGSGTVGHIVCVGSKSAGSATGDATSVGEVQTRPSEPGMTRIEGGIRLVDSLALGLGAAACFGPERILVVTADLPWLTSEGVGSFVADAPSADLVYPVVGRDTMEQRFPAQRRTYAMLREGAFTGGNMILIRPTIVPSLLLVIDRAHRARKNPLVLATLLGWDLGLRLILRNLPIPVAERRVSALLGGEARALISDDAALAADIDRPEHLSFVPPTEGLMAGEPR